jgi:putative transcriptional regulator
VRRWWLQSTNKPILPSGGWGTRQAIARLRRKAHVSQAVFAHHLNVSPTTVSQWERGEKSPSGPSLKLLALAYAKGLTAIA